MSDTIKEKLEELQILISEKSGESPVYVGCSDHPYILGKNYLILTVTSFYIGRMVAVGDQELVLEDASWIADTGRFHECFGGVDKLDEVEPLPTGRVLVGRNALILAVVWDNPLPRLAK